MNWKMFCCCLYLYSGTKSEEDAPLDTERFQFQYNTATSATYNLYPISRTQHKPFNFIGGVLNWTREKRKVKAGSNHDHLHHTLGREVGDAGCHHVYAKPTQSSCDGQNATPESVSLVQKIVGNRLYKTFEKNNNKQQNKVSAVPQSCDQEQESPFDSFEATESFDADVTSMPSLRVTGSLTNRNPRAVSEYQNVPQQYLPTQTDYRYPENRRVSQPNIPPPPPRCYYNQPILDRRGFQPNIDNRRQIKSFQ